MVCGKESGRKLTTEYSVQKAGDSLVIHDREIADAIRTAVELGATGDEWQTFAAWLAKRRTAWLDKCFQN